ncbi:hypothetical protein AD006_32115 (plasmid) [Pseudonocardia sp. EC080610-09]|uniref:3,4-dihydroxy-2-butanone-4-phosphate synthase n=1 Tax=unclassified Pseudonocardia TaxID=2619320 RepID=UPI000706E18A|nr:MULTISPECIES: 3,4-dihydroxy-2-butanone-4-phosphate synthase [unclassified Pseudonocardia]ALL79783.1 hypothetical protein AD006_28250 [Pseudonocardia sp. EC080610-09]ALL79909.1 hypothetical protein AD006_32115 [Pseudonocardia sp. EC080610-09]ALL85702.1 hypothetical protein AD017_28645 [Pseudonocardia sp. EC080619-01]
MAGPDPLRARERVGRAAQALADGEPVVVTAETGAHLVLAARRATTPWMAFLVRHTAGLVCVALDGSTCDRLRLVPMAVGFTAHRSTAYCVSVDLHGTGTGISASARARTVAALGDPATKGADLCRPGHVIPIRTRERGVLDRAEPAEAASDLVRLADGSSAAALSELLSSARPGEVATPHEATAFADQHDLSVVAIVDLMAYRAAAPGRVRRVTHTALPTSHGPFTAVGYLDTLDGAEHIVLLIGSPDEHDPGLLRLHRECVLGDVLGSQACECRAALAADLDAVAAAGRGAVVYLRTGSRELSCASSAAPHGAAGAIVADLCGAATSPSSVQADAG